MFSHHLKYIKYFKTKIKTNTFYKLHIINIDSEETTVIIVNAVSVHLEDQIQTQTPTHISGLPITSETLQHWRPSLQNQLGSIINNFAGTYKLLEEEDNYPKYQNSTPGFSFCFFYFFATWPFISFRPHITSILKEMEIFISLWKWEGFAPVCNNIYGLGAQRNLAFVVKKNDIYFNIATNSYNYTDKHNIDNFGMYFHLFDQVYLIFFLFLFYKMLTS